MHYGAPVARPRYWVGPVLLILAAGAWWPFLLMLVRKRRGFVYTLRVLAAFGGIACGTVALVAFNRLANWPTDGWHTAAVLGVTALTWLGWALAGGMGVYLRYAQTTRRRLCQRCEYDLRGTLAAGLDRCPECGEAVLQPVQLSS
jgi:hypothetical protein